MYDPVWMLKDIIFYVLSSMDDGIASIMLQEAYIIRRFHNINDIKSRGTK